MQLQTVRKTYHLKRTKISLEQIPKIMYTIFFACDKLIFRLIIIKNMSIFKNLHNFLKAQIGVIKGNKM